MINKYLGVKCDTSYLKFTDNISVSLHKDAYEIGAILAKC